MTPRLALLMIALLVGCTAGAGSQPPQPADSGGSQPAAVPSSTPSAAASPAGATGSPSAAGGQGATAPARAAVRVGQIGATIGDAPIFIAEDRGYFQEEGLDVDRTPFDSAARMIPALAGGQLDVGGGAISAGLFNAVGRGVSLLVVADKGSFRDGDRWNSIAVRKDLYDSGAIRDWPDLRGRSIGIPSKGTGNEIVFARGLASAGLGLDDVDLKEMGLPDIGVSLANGSLDVGLQPEPFLTRGIEQGSIALWKGVGDVLPGAQFTVIMYAGAFAREHPDAARRYMTAYVRGIRDYYDAFLAHRTDPDPLARFIADFARLPNPDLVKRMYPVRFDPDGRVNADSIASDYEYFRSTGDVTADLDPRRLVDPQFVDYAISRLGPYR
ncbi:MAG TPA: ABC transporter substrate-binding protein [Chloroflexota bacterium]|nr:ABC transporter substrate-binding protein [Chloroflexota bacterium]